MKLLIDDARTDVIRRLCDLYPIDGVTTNPTILLRAGRAPFEVLHEIRDILGADRELHVQVVARDAAGMLKDAERICSEVGRETFIKVPCVPEGYKAMKEMKRRGMRVTGTAAISPMQVLWASNCGAQYVAAYVNRMDDFGVSGVEQVRVMQELLDQSGTDTEILGASFRNTQQVLDVALCGVRASTAAPDILEAYMKNTAITSAVEAFTRDFEKLAGPGKTMADC